MIQLVPASSKFTNTLTNSTMAVALCAALFAACGNSKSASNTGVDGGGGAAGGGGGRGGAGGLGGAGLGGAGGAVLTVAQLRGKYLVDAVVACGDCHTPRTATGAPDFTKYLAGNASFAQLPNGDRLPSRNLTNDETGLKNYTDEQIKAMILDGVRPSGASMEPLHPVMPYYIFKNMTAADADAIVAYLRVVPGVENMIPRRGVSFDVPAPAPPLDITKLPPIPAAFPERASALRGQYLAAQVGLCLECHTKHLPPGAPSVLDEAHLFEGGEDYSPFFTSLMITPISKNLTSDPTTGIGTWTTAEIVAALKQGVSKDGTGICPPMPVGPLGAYGHLTDADATDIANYLRSLPPKVNLVPDMCVFPPMRPAGDGGASDGGDAGAGADAVASADGGVDVTVGVDGGAGN